MGHQDGLRLLQPRTELGKPVHIMSKAIDNVIVQARGKNTRFWEGGTGQRNKRFLSVKDPHKYRNSKAKTVLFYIPPRTENQVRMLFVGRGQGVCGGLSWETTDAKLRQYFENYGAVQESYVSYDRHTGRPRGFGFVVFSDPQVVDKVVTQQHTIDRREVEAKKALPKEESPVSKDMQAAASGQRTKKIFVGGLAGTVDEEVFTEYFGGFGKVEDAVVMYDQQNRRPRGFGFITFAEEEAVDAVFAKGTIHVLHDKQIEIKRAIPRDSGPIPSPKTLYRSPYERHHGFRLLVQQAHLVICVMSMPWVLP
eukprot:jgi/Picre1/27321/NNA_000290.t1